MRAVCRGRLQLEKVAEKITRLDPDKVWCIDARLYAPRRSTDQNNYAWKIYRAVAEATGEPDAERIHDAYKRMFGEVIERPDPLTGELVKVYTTHDTDHARFSLYLSRVEAHAAELGVHLEA